MVKVELHTDRLPLEQDDLEETADQVFRAVEDTPETVHIWESSRTHYHGRDHDGDAHVGINVGRFTEEIDESLFDIEVPGEDLEPAERMRYVLAHEMGHDVAEREYEDTNEIDAWDHVENDRLQVGETDRRRTHDPPMTVTRQVFGEMVAELAGEETQVGLDLGRHPFPGGGEQLAAQLQDLSNREFVARRGERVQEVAAHVEDIRDDGIRELTRLPTTRFDDETSVYKDSHAADDYGVEVFVQEEGAMETLDYHEDDDMEAIEYRIDMLDGLQEAYGRDDIDTTEFLRIAVESDWTSIDLHEHPTPFYEVVMEYVDEDPEDLSYSDFSPRSGSVTEVIEEYEDEIVQEVVRRTTDQIADRVGELSDRYRPLIDDPDSAIGFPESEDMVEWLDEHQQVYRNAEFDFSHKVGCTLGRLLYERDITMDDVLEEEATYQEIAREAVQEAVSRGYESMVVGQDDEATMQEFEASARYIIDKEIGEDQYSSTSDYRER